MIVPPKFIRALPPVVGKMFKQWAGYMYSTIPFQLKDSPIHSTAHSERVLLYALLMGNSEVSDDERILTILAHASVFHDTRREDEWKDTVLMIICFESIDSIQIFENPKDILDKF